MLFGSSFQVNKPARPARRRDGPPRSPEAQGISRGKESPQARSLEPVVGPNLRRLRTTRGLSLERLARASGVSRAMLGQIELGQSTPTINTIWKIARALNCQFSVLITNQPSGETKVLRAVNAKVLTSKDGKVSSRALFPPGRSRQVEFYELRLAPLSSECAEPHEVGTVENLVVTSGSLEMVLGDIHHTLMAGDAMEFEADVRHEYRNAVAAETVIYLMMTYAGDLKRAWQQAKLSGFCLPAPWRNGQSKVMCVLGKNAVTQDQICAQGAVRYERRLRARSAADLGNCRARQHPQTFP
jgi:transcriptional regulator with XRE-family HTH domain